MNKRELKKEIADKKAIRACARSFGVVGDENRLKMCYLLCHYPELSVGEIADAVGLSLSAASRSLKKLKELQVVKNRRCCRQIFYSLGNDKLTAYLKSALAEPIQ